MLAVLVSAAVLAPGVAVAGANGSSGTTPSSAAVPVVTPPSVPIFVSGPPPGALQLLDEVSASENQLISMSGIDEARSFVSAAARLQGRAQRVLVTATRLWKVTLVQEQMAQAVRAQALAQVILYEEAIGQLGLAEYTGLASTPTGSMDGQESALDQAELASVAATVATGSLKQAKVFLSQAEAQLGQARRVVAAAWSKVHQATVVLHQADEQLDISKADVLLARRWALGTAPAPTSPGVALLRKEGVLGAKELTELVREGRQATTTTAPVEPLNGAGLPLATVTTAPTGPSGSSASTTSPTGRSTTTLVLPGGTVPTTLPGGKLAPAYEGPSILGPALLSVSDITGWYGSTGYHAHTTVPIGRLARDYINAGTTTGVRADIAFAQSVVETGYFSFPAGGQLTGANNNFAGIGACDSCKHGWKFPSAAAGVLAQERLLEAYATPPQDQLNLSSLAGLGVQGCCTTWLALSGVWASNPDYGYIILGIYNEMLDWAIPKHLRSDGLISAARFAAEELQLPLENARTSALVAAAMAANEPSSSPGTGPCPPAGGKPGATGPASNSTTGSSTTSSSSSTTGTTASGPGEGKKTAASTCPAAGGTAAPPSSTTTSTTAGQGG